MTILFRPELVYTGDRFEGGKQIVVADDGIIQGIEDWSIADSGEVAGATIENLPGRAMLPGMIDVHSHSFQRTIRGSVESRLKAGPNFWSWRDAMYRAANRFSPEELYTIACMAFMEMALAGITTVGEFHYVHRDRDGSPYENPNEIALQVIRAANDVGIRIALLRVAYVRAGFNKPADAGQRRFIEPTSEEFLTNTDALRSALRESGESAWIGVAPHSIRAVPIDYLREITAWARSERLPVHMHVAEQPAENDACMEEYGTTPFALLDREGILEEKFTAIHGIHLSAGEIAALGRSGAIIGACPTTERNLGDGILPADALMRAGVRIAFGSDSLTQIDPLENARELEYNLRLKQLERAVLDNVDGTALPQRLFACSTVNGAASLGANAGTLAPGMPADFFSVDFHDPSIAGSGPEELLASIVFGLAKTAIAEVAVNGRFLVQGGRHQRQEAVIRDYAALMRRQAGVYD
ncbi:Formiminoglutamic iminohydrolase [Acidisarcina polymorpha]|uniref:Formiminoglutamic iminohydrolase n=1 Tax=Acidisarcina polymorpha TaxID=2211140 RepID=A0A2Z5FYI4_9BACT|nr:formimidoylglutamate deiminase [Acidisarcina polymorpha]AXC11770.1 Formiminoglutamic iminohydrolase [Acidisarcina polymorpha]